MQIFIKTMKFTNLTTLKNFQLEGIKKGLQWLLDYIKQCSLSKGMWMM